MVASKERIIILRNKDKNDWSYSYDPNEDLLPPTNCTIESFILSDINRDGDNDVLIGLRNMTSKGSTLLRILKNSGGKFQKVYVDIDLNGIGTKAIAVADVTHDKFPDIIIGSVSFDFNTPSRKLINDGSHSTQLFRAIAILFSFGITWMGLVLQKLYYRHQVIFLPPP